MARRYITAGAIRDAAGKHGPITGTHNHSHFSYGHPSGDDDQQHSHGHAHDGDGDHDHGDAHEAWFGAVTGQPGARYRRDAPGAVLDALPAARSWGAFLAAVADPDGDAARQMKRAAAAARPLNADMSERVPAEGGFLVPERLRAQILSYLADSIVRPRSQYVLMDSLRVPIPVLDNPSQADGIQALGGLTFAMVAEGAGITPSVPEFGRIALECRKAAAYLQDVPNELVDDSAAFTDVFLPQIIARGYGWFVDDMCIGTGSGVGEPQALVNAPAALAVTRGTSDEVQLTDIVAMLKKLHPASKSNATWIIADEVFGQLLDMYLNFGSATSGLTPPPDWLRFDSQAGCWRLLGLECCPSDHLPGLGSTGDVMLCDLRLMLVGDRGELSIERSQQGGGFVSDTSNFRIRARIDARYWPQSSYTLASGQTASPLVILQ